MVQASAASSCIAIAFHGKGQIPSRSAWTEPGRAGRLAGSPCMPRGGAPASDRRGQSSRKTALALLLLLGFLPAERRPPRRRAWSSRRRRLASSPTPHARLGRQAGRDCSAATGASQFGLTTHSRTGKQLSDPALGLLLLPGCSGGRAEPWRKASLPACLPASLRPQQRGPTTTALAQPRRRRRDSKLLHGARAGGIL